MIKYSVYSEILVINKRCKSTLLVFVLLKYIKTLITRMQVEALAKQILSVLRKHFQKFLSKLPMIHTYFDTNAF